MATDFGKRLRAAREHAGLTQTELASKIPMAQSTLAAAETSGDGSRVIAQLAHHCGVNAYWLATGEGEMLDGVTAAPAAAPLTAAEALPVVLDALLATDEGKREELAQMLGWFLRTGAPTYRTRVTELLTAPPAPWDGVERRSGSDRRKSEAPPPVQETPGRFAA